jgi:hypothetical protein
MGLPSRLRAAAAPGLPAFRAVAAASFSDQDLTMTKALRLLAAAHFLFPALAHAGPSEYIYLPTVEYGEREIDTKYGTAKLPDGAGRESAASLGFGWGAKEWWFTEAYLKYHKEPAGKTKYDAFEWENKFQLTDTGRYPVDVGLITEFEAPRERKTEGYEFRIGPLLQWETGLVQWNANVLFTRVFRGQPAPDEPRFTELGYQFQVKYRASSAFEYGVQAFGDLGRWDRWAPSGEQSHRLGPAVFGKFRVGEHEMLRYNAAWLAGLDKGAPDNTFRVQAEYEF